AASTCAPATASRCSGRPGPSGRSARGDGGVPCFAGALPADWQAPGTRRRKRRSSPTTLAMKGRMIKLTRFAALAAAALALAVAATGQSSPPGPTVPEKPLPVPKPGEDLVINPTIEECKVGWRPGLRWTKAQFEQLCAQLRISK